MEFYFRDLRSPFTACATRNFPFLPPSLVTHENPPPASVTSYFSLNLAHFSQFLSRRRTKGYFAKYLGHLQLRLCIPIQNPSDSANIARASSHLSGHGQESAYISMRQLLY